MSTASMAVAAVSTVVEWYDFTLFLYVATVLARVFVGAGEASLLATLAGFAVAYLLRPIGAVVFGHIGDRYGRRRSMMLSMAIVTLAMAATAALPTQAQVGAAAGWLLLLLRCITAFCVGGEYIGVVAYLLEGAAPDRRGFVTSLASAASEVGALLAVGLSAAVAATVSAGALDAWGWRIPFAFGALLAGAVWVARSFMDESPEFERQQAAGTVPDAPFRRALAEHRGPIARGFAISALGSITYYVGITYVPAFLVSVGKVAESASLMLSTAAAVVVIAVTPLFGLAADRYGRRPVLVALAVAGLLLPLPMFHLMTGGVGPALLGAVVMAALGGAVSAVGAVATAEQFPGEGRLTGLALGATTATAIFGGFAPWAAQALIARSGWPLVPGAMIAAVALCVAPVLLTLREAPRT